MAANIERLQKYVYRICRLWQKLLRLEDWEVVVEIVRSFEIGENNAAEIDVFASKKYAKLSLLHPDDCDPNWEPGGTLEQKIVHELLHISLNSIGQYDDEAKRMAEEQFVHILSFLLVRLAGGEK